MTGRAILNSKCIEAAIKGLPPLPPIVSKILEEMDKEEVSINQIEQLLSADQALVAKVLRIVNSSYYGLSGQVRSLSQAIVILGMQQVRNLVLGISAMGVLQPKNLKDHSLLQRLWSESFATAVGARVIGKSRNLCELQIELVFVGGLLHRIGKLFLLIYFEDKLAETRSLADRLSMSDIDSERQVLGLSHREIGRRLGEQWRLPQDLIGLISYEEIPVGAEDEDNYRIVDAASIACELGADGQSKPVDAAAQSIAWVGFDAADWDWFKREVSMRVEAMAEYAGLAA
jgi:HD-like signal output (HDOD) protein